MRSQIVTSSWGGAKYKPMAFTEQGVAMLSSVLNSSRAIEVNIAIMRAFVQLRKSVASKKEIEKRRKKNGGIYHPCAFGVICRLASAVRSF